MSKEKYKFQRIKTLNSIPKIFLNVTQLRLFLYRKIDIEWKDKSDIVVAPWLYPATDMMCTCNIPVGLH